MAAQTTAALRRPICEQPRRGLGRGCLRRGLGPRLRSRLKVAEDVARPGRRPEHRRQAQLRLFFDVDAREVEGVEAYGHKEGLDGVGHAVAGAHRRYGAGLRLLRLLFSPLGHANVFTPQVAARSLWGPRLRGAHLPVQVQAANTQPPLSASHALAGLPMADDVVARLAMTLAHVTRHREGASRGRD